MLLPETVLQDLHYGARMLSRKPAFTAVAVLALALGIGVNTTVFTAYKTMVARPIDARDASAMVNLALLRESGAPEFNFSYPDYEAYRDSVHSLRGLIAFGTEHLTLSAVGGTVGPRSGVSAEFTAVAYVSENYFQVLGVPALRGRTFESIKVPELVAAPSVLISENCWQKRFDGDPAILGTTVLLNGVAAAIVGITPRDFAGVSMFVPDFWLPIRLEPLVHADDNMLTNREQQRYRLFGRLAPGIEIAQARAEMTLATDRLRRLHAPHSDAAKPATVLVWPASPFPLPLNLYAGLTFTIVAVMSAAAMVLVVACANVGSLQLARARSRQNELHTRLSLGASRGRMIRQLLTESMLLGLLAGAVALLFTWALLQVAVVFAAEALPPGFGTLIYHVTPDLPIFAYVFAISLVASVLFGLAPAIESSRSALSAASRGSTSPARSRRLQDLLIAAQVALSLVLMIAGSMFIRSSMRALHMETGYDGKHVIDLNFPFPEASRYTAGRKLALVREVRTQLASLPGVAAVTIAQPPDQNSYATVAVSLNPEKTSVLHYTYVEPNYFQTLGIPLLRGGGFPQAGQAERSVILSESAANHLWPNQNPIGLSVRLGPTDERTHTRSELLADGPAYQVIGVARDTRGVQFDGSDSKQVYLPLPEDRLLGRPVLIRIASDPAQAIRAINAVVSSIDPDLVATSDTLEAQLRRDPPFVVSMLAAGVASTIGLLGLLLASMGIYATVNYIVVLRTREVGIRMAIGAQERDIRGLILGESTRPVVFGLLVGIGLALGASYLLRGVLYGLHTVDGTSFAGVSMLFLAIALLAAYPPSRRASRVDPMVALRHE
jgi:predicted permease